MQLMLGYVPTDSRTGITFAAHALVFYYGRFPYDHQTIYQQKNR